MKYRLLGVYFLFLFSFLNAQNNPQEKAIITGKIFDKTTNKPLEFASVYFESNDAKINKGTTSDKRGKFKIEIPVGIYKFTVSFLSYKSHVINAISFNKDINLGVISLRYDTNKLAEVSLNYTKDIVEFKLEKKIYNVSKDIANAGGTALSVLENAPYVNVDGANNVSIRNNSNIQILINGKPSGIVDGDMSNLSAIPANSILKVEIITSKSAKYDAEGSGGIINIVLKKGKGMGLNTAIETHVGMPDDDGLSANINYKSKAVKFFSTTGYNHSSNPEKENVKQEFLNSDLLTTGFFDQISKTTKQANSFLTNFGADFYLNDKTTLTASVLFKTRDKNYNTTSTLNDFDATNSPLKTSKRKEDNDNNVDRYEYLISFVRDLKKEGESLSLDFKYNHAKANSLGAILETTSLPISPNKVQKSVKDQKLDTYLIQADYVLPVGKFGQIETGLKSAIRNYTNNYNVSELDIASGIFTTIGGFNDAIKYDETINAAYLQFSSYNTWSYSIGFRIENSDIAIGLENSLTKINKNYTDVFPTASLSYKFEDKSVLNTSYSRSIDRPSLRNINPFMSFSNERFQTVGNPDLNPYYTDYLELDYYKRYKKTTMAVSLFYSYSTDLLTYILEETGLSTSDGFTIYKRKPINNGNYSVLGGDLDLTYYPIKKIRLKAYSSFYNVAISKTLNGLYNDSDFRWYTQMSSLITFKSGLKFQLKYDYQSAFSTGQIKLKPQQYASLAFSKEILKRQATLTFRLNDIFETRNDILFSTEANTNSQREVRYNDRQFLLSFTYRIKQKKRRDKHNRLYDIDTDDFK
ncbi:MAG: TonB-dependent receptor family protein [Flavobacteriaceae bacterium]|nr:TonB-dependent receptor family protein [Flavobacteriaceae bacterium]